MHRESEIIYDHANTKATCNFSCDGDFERKHSCEAQKLYGDGSGSVLLENQKLQTLCADFLSFSSRFSREARANMKRHDDPSITVRQGKHTHTHALFHNSQ